MMRGPAVEKIAEDGSHYGPLACAVWHWYVSGFLVNVQNARRAVKRGLCHPDHVFADPQGAHGRPCVLSRNLIEHFDCVEEQHPRSETPSLFSSA
jgi:hypothetical protein